MLMGRYANEASQVFGVHSICISAHWHICISFSKTYITVLLSRTGFLAQRRQLFYGAVVLLFEQQIISAHNKILAL